MSLQMIPKFVRNAIFVPQSETRLQLGVQFWYIPYPDYRNLRK
jgi:hypothetical protein